MKMNTKGRTSINLLMRFYDPWSGRILLDSHSTLDITRESLRRYYAMVLQDSWLFHGTIAENVAYSSTSATLDDVIRVCKAAYIHDAVMQLPLGYDTMLTDDGTNLSKGQKQMLTLRRPCFWMRGC